MSSGPFSTSFRGPVMLLHGRANVISLLLSRDDETVTPSAASVRVEDGSGHSLWSGAATIGAGGLCAATVPAIDRLPAEGWLVTWSVTVEGEVIPLTCEAVHVLQQLYPVVSIETLRGERADLFGSGSVTSAYQAKIDRAWEEISARIIAEGKRPWLVVGPSALAEVHTCLALAKIYEDRPITGSAAAAATSHAKTYRDRYEAAWGRLVLTQSDPARLRGSAPKTAARSGLWLC